MVEILNAHFSKISITNSQCNTVRINLGLQKQYGREQTSKTWSTLRIEQIIMRA